MNQEQIEKLKEKLNKNISESFEQHLDNINKLNNETKTKGETLTPEIMFEYFTKLNNQSYIDMCHLVKDCFLNFLDSADN